MLRSNTISFLLFYLSFFAQYSIISFFQYSLFLYRINMASP